MQERMRKLVEESSTKKKAKKKLKDKEKMKKPPVGNNMSGKGNHTAGGKNNSLVNDSIGASIASVVMGAGDVRLPGDMHHVPPPASKSLATMHHASSVHTPHLPATAKAAKSKGKHFDLDRILLRFLPSP